MTFDPPNGHDSTPECMQSGRICARQLYLWATKESQPQKWVGGDFFFNPPGRSDLAEHHLSFPIDWNDDPFSDRNWCGQLHMWRIIDQHLIQHDKTRDVSWLDFPLAIMRDWHRYHQVEKRRSLYAWKDMIAGLRAMKLAYVMSQVQHGLLRVDDETIAIFNDLVRSHLAFLLDHANFAYSNHSFADLHGAAALAQVVDEQQRLAVYQVIDHVLPGLLATQFDDAGVHLENSPGYQPFGIGCLKRLVNSGWFDGKGVRELIEKAEAVFDWFKMPDGRIVPIGDSDGKAQDLSVKETAFRGRCQVLNRSGYAIVRDDGGGEVSRSSYLAFMGALNSRFHKQSDDLTLVWFEGEDILCDAGKYAYKTDDFRAYITSTRAHNTVEIDGENYYTSNQIPSEVIYGSAIGAVAVHNWGYLIDANVRHVKFGVRHARFLVYRPGTWLLVIDRLIGEQPHEFTQWFHFAPKIEKFSEIEGGYAGQLPSGKSLTVQSVASEPVNTEWIRGATEPRLQGWISQAYRQIEPNFALGIQQSGKDVVFATLFTLNDGGSTLALQPNHRLTLSVRTNVTEVKLRITIGEHSCRVHQVT